MTRRILRIELRRSTAVWAALLLAATGGFMLRALNPPYDTWMQVVTIQRDMMQLTWPLALAAGAWQAGRERRSRVDELVGTTPRPRWRRVQPIAAAMALAAAVGYLLMLAGGAINIQDVGGYFSLRSSYRSSRSEPWRWSPRSGSGWPSARCCPRR